MVVRWIFRTVVTKEAVRELCAESRVTTSFGYLLDTGQPCEPPTNSLDTGQPCKPPTNSLGYRCYLAAVLIGDVNVGWLPGDVGLIGDLSLGSFGPACRAVGGRDGSGSGLIVA